jgi:hypothetical protein
MPAVLGRRILAALLLVLACSLTLGTSNAIAGIAWCRVDPVVVIDGQLADIYVASNLAMQLKATGPVQMVISLPPESTGKVLLTDTGFGLQGYQISFVTDDSLIRTASSNQVRVAVYAPARDGSLPVQVTVAPRSLNASLRAILFGWSADGFANSWVTLTTP